MTRASWEDTLVVFVSDHGEMLGDHYHIAKSYPFEASAGIPFLINPPEAWGAPRMQVLDQPVGLQDVMPTLVRCRRRRDPVLGHWSQPRAAGPRRVDGLARRATPGIRQWSRV